MRGSPGWCTLAVTAIAALGPSTVAAQAVVGRVLERGGGGVVVGAMVRLTQDGAQAGAPWLTAEDGRFRLEAPAPGRYHLVVERIGFTTTTVRGLEVAPNGILSIDVAVETEAVALDGIHVEARGGRCGPDGGGGTAQLIWDEARKALSAATWTKAEVVFRFTATAWDREIDPRTSQIVRERLEDRETVGHNSVQSLPPDELAREGYVRIDPAYSFYYAPDADVLLSDAFQDTHCFRVVEPEGRSSPLVGLAFEPDQERGRPDVRGVIWLDRRSARLDHVQFGYTGLSVAGADRAGGEVHWAELANGRWIVRRWSIRAPMGATRAGSADLGRTPLERSGGLRRAAGLVHEVGSELDSVEGEDFVWRPDIAPGTLRGVVYDSIRARVLAGAEVRVAGRGLRTVSDLTGRFELEGVPPGSHRVTFSHAGLDSLGVTPGWVTAALLPGETVEVDLTVPAWTTLLGRSCQGDVGGTVVGIVRDRSGRPVPGARVELRRTAPETTDGATPRGDADEAGRAITDGFGAYVLCGVSPGVVRLAGRRGSAEAPSSETRAVAGQVVFSDLVLRPRPAAPTDLVPGVLRPALIGTVAARGTGRPLPDVSIELLDAEGVVIASTESDDDGAFRVVLDEGGEVYLSVSRFGYSGAVTEAIDVTDGTRRIEITLPEEAIEIEPVVVVVDRRHPKLESEGFYARAVSTPGMFIRRDDVEAVAPARTTDLLGRAPGVRVRTDPLSGDLRRRVTFQRLALAGGDRCYPTVFVDGDMVRVGGSRAESESPVIEGIEPVIEQGSDIPTLDELVPPEEILAVEMYQIPGRVPRRFVGLGTHCGVIVVWTTRGDGAPVGGIAPGPALRRGAG